MCSQKWIEAASFTRPFHGTVLTSNSPALPVKIFVLGDGSLLDEGICNLLILHAQLSVTRIFYTDDHTLLGLVNSEHPYAIFINEFDGLDIGRVIRMIFSAPAAFVRCVIVAHVEKSKLDVYDRPTKPALARMYRRKSVVVNTKEEFINLALKIPVVSELSSGTGNR